MIFPSSFRPVLYGVLLLVGSLLLTGCSDESLLATEVSSDTFTRYVALGNSITAGFQSQGIVASTQDSSYAALLAGQMNTRFDLPRLAPPGCPPPVENIFVSNVTDGGSESDCGLRSAPAPTVLNNVAVPGAGVIDALSNSAPGSSPGSLTTLILGGRTQIEAARAVRPTFASVWLGNNEALDAALSGNTDALIDASTFESQITRVVDSLVDAGADRGVLVSVANPTLIPNLSPGQAYADAESQINQFGQSLASESWGGYTVASSCEAPNPGAETRIPFSYGFQTLFQQALQGQSVQLDCAPSTAPDALLTPSKQNTIVSRVQDYNNTLSSLADEHDWAYVDATSALQALYTANAANDDPSDDLVPKFPNPPSNFANPADNPPTFGRYFSEDGVHPSSTTHRIVGHLIIRELNRQYEDVELEQLSIPNEVQPLLQ